MKKYFIASFVVMLALIFATPEVAQAHVLKVDGSIGAVLHINPDDNPTTAGPTQYILSFNGDSSFSLQHCDCAMHVIKNGNEIATQPLAATSSTISEDTYTFKTPDVYTLEVIGSSKTPGLFPSFKLDYDVRVTNGKVEAQPFPPLLTLGVALAIGLILLGSFAGMYNDEQNIAESKGE